MGNSKRIGNIGEEIASKYLEESGYKILERNFYTKFGELDIIALYKNEYIFIEVKTRRSINYGFPSEAINTYKEKHIKNSAKFYLFSNGLADKAVRFDVIEVYILDKVYINHLKNVFF